MVKNEGYNAVDYLPINTFFESTPFQIKTGGAMFDFSTLVIRDLSYNTYYDAIDKVIAWNTTSLSTNPQYPKFVNVNSPKMEALNNLTGTIVPQKKYAETYTVRINQMDGTKETCPYLFDVFVFNPTTNLVAKGKTYAPKMESIIDFDDETVAKDGIFVKTIDPGIDSVMTKKFGEKNGWALANNKASIKFTKDKNGIQNLLLHQ
jgi:hypothetical protein